jgi:hypothetical protein
MRIQVRWHDGYKKTYTANPASDIANVNNVEMPRIGPDWLWIDRGPEHQFRYVHIPTRSVREVRTDVLL